MTAQCSLHPEVLAETTCVRCGRFCCGACIIEKPNVCTTCAPMLDPYAVRGRVLDVLHGAQTALKLVRLEWPAIFALSMAFAVPLAIFDYLLELRGGDETKQLIRSIQLSSAYNTFFGLIGSQALVAIFIARLEGRRLSLGQALRESSLRWTRGVGANIRSSFTILFFALLLIIPGIWKTIMLAWTTVAVMRVRTDALQTSETLVRGRLGITALYGIVATLPIAIITGLISLGFDAVAESFELPLLVPRLLTAIMNWVADEAFALAMLTAGFVMAHRSADVPLPPMTWLVEQPPLINER